MAEKYGIPHGTTDYREVLADPEVQAVVVATREDAQAPLAIEALRAGKHVYVEKPLALRSEVCEAVVRTEKETGCMVAVGFNRRMAPAYREAKRLVWRKGGPKNVYYRIASPWSPHYPPGSRMLIEICHVFDILRWFTESDAETIYCVSSRPDDDICTLKFRSGCVATVLNCGYATIDMPKEHVEIMHEMGGVIVDEFVELRSFGFESDVEPVTRFPGHTHPDNEYMHKHLMRAFGLELVYALRRTHWKLKQAMDAGEDGARPFDDAEQRRYLRETCPSMNYIVDKGWLWAIDHFAQCIANGARPETAGAEDAWKASLLAHAAVRSRETGEVVRLSGRAAALPKTTKDL